MALKAISKDRGFTLIELIMVIVILGILSAFALPKFADFSSDAESSSIEGARGAVRSASAITHAACLASTSCNANGATSTVTMEGVVVDMVYGYPSRTDLTDAASLDGYWINTSTTNTIIALEKSTNSKCFTYANATISGTTITAPVMSVAGTYGTNSTDSDDTDDTCTTP